MVCGYVHQVAMTFVEHRFLRSQSRLASGLVFVVGHGGGYDEGGSFDAFRSVFSDNFRFHVSWALGRWPSQNDDEVPDCGLFFCEFTDDGDEDLFTADQTKIVTIYEVSTQRRQQHILSCPCTSDFSFSSVRHDTERTVVVLIFAQKLPSIPPPPFVARGALI